MDGRESSRNMQFTLLWEDMLRDNLLNFAGTPKGLLLLQQTGAINECVSYMHSRYARKVQVRDTSATVCSSRALATPVNHRTYRIIVCL